MIIEKLTAEQATGLKGQLMELLLDAVADGASVGFLDPLSDETALQFWADVVRDLAQGSRVLLVVRSAHIIVGSVQLNLCTRPNGLHRAEVQKLLVHSGARRRGIGRKLMGAVEEAARRAGRSLLYLDTESHKPAETMYRNMGWVPVGEIPDFALTTDGRMHGTTIFYKKLGA